jgi:hypothetical protein
MKKLCIIAVLAFALPLTWLGCNENGGSDDQTEDTTTQAEDDASGTVDEDLAVEEDLAVVDDDVTVPEEDTGTTGPDETPPEVTMDIEPYAIMAGNMELAVDWTDDSGIEKVEVYLDGQLAGEVNPENKMVDTTMFKAGLADLAFRVFDKAGKFTNTEPVPVICQGPGQFVEFFDGWDSGSIDGWTGFVKEVPPSVDSIYDEKAHVMVDQGIGTVHAFLRWESKSSWNLGLDIGTGNCPDSGQKLAESDLDAPAGVIHVQYSTPTGDPVPTGKWFAHIRFIDGGDHDGATQQFNTLFLVTP